MGAAITRPGLWAAAAALLAQWLLHIAVPEAPFAPYSIAERIIRESPGPLVTWGIEQMGHNAMRLLSWSCVLAALPLAWLLGRRNPLLFGGLAFLLTLFAARIDPMPPDMGPTLLSAAVAGIAATLAAALFVPIWSDTGEDADGTRRRLLAGAGLAVLFWITGAGALVRRQTEDAPSGPVRADTRAVVAPDPTFEPVEGLSPRITPTADHYIVDIALEDPRIGGGWQLEIRGKVAHELSLSFNNLQAMRTREVLLVMQCISNEVGGGLIGNSMWTGVPTAALIELAAPADDARWVLARSEDGFTDVLDIAALTNPDSMIALGMNGSVLTRSHGYPARLLYPGHYGMRSVKWIKELELLDEDEEGYWAARGWDRTALMRTGSRIDEPDDGATVGTSFVVAGVAYAGDRRIRRVEVTADDGATWHEAHLENELGLLSWRRWRRDMQLKPGDYELKVRAYDGTGAAQDEEGRKPHPSGASGYHRVSITVEAV